MLRKKRKISARVTIVAYLLAFVLPNIGQVAVAQNVQNASPVDATDLAWTLGIAPIRPASARPALKQPAAPVESAVGVPSVLNSRSPLSAAILTSVGGRGTQFSEASLLADWDGKEDLTADRGAKIADLSAAEVDIDATLTRSAISAHTVANGFNENVYYYGDSVGNIHVGVDIAPGAVLTPGPAVDVVHTLHLPTMLNAFGSLSSDDQIVVTGLCVSPVADLTSYALVNGSFAPFTGQIGEILIVTYTDTGSGLRLNTDNQITRSGVLAIPVADMVSPAAAPPGVQTPAGFPVTVGGAFGVVFSAFSNLAGCAVDDDGSVYFQNVDLQQFTGANIVKISRVGTNQDRSVATSSFAPAIVSLNPAGGLYGTSSGPAEQVNRYTNYSGTSTTFGNIAALAAGPGNTLYAAMAASADSGATATGLFTNPAALGPTPSMIVSFADAVGVHSPSAGVRLPDSFADVAVPGAALSAGVNNFRVFVHGSGPDRRGAPAGVFGTAADTLKVDLQVDYTIYSGLAVNEDRQVFVIHGGTPASVGRDPSPTFGEIQVFPDRSPANRRADYIDLRGNQPPNGPISGGNAGDADSDRYDHIFMQAPVDIVTATPTGLAGLSRGFLRYTNRLAPNPISPGITLGQTAGQRVQGDDSFNGPIFFGGLDPGNQAGGGDDQNPPSTGDDSATAGNPPLAIPAQGGFEFNFGASVGGICTAPWNAFFLNSNGNISFGAGDTDNIPTANDLLTGVPRIAPAWKDWNPNTRAGALNTFPVQAIGFADVNHFKVRWINVPHFGQEAAGSRNTFSVSLFDDGTAVDENAPLTQEGPTDNRFTPGLTSIFAAPARPNGSAAFTFEYGWMDASATLTGDTIVGYSIGGLVAGSVGEVNLSELGRSAAIGTGAAAETAIFELFSAGDFDLRSEGNDPVASMFPGQANPSREILDFFGKACDHLLLSLVTEVVGSGTVTGIGIACPGDCTESVASGGPVVLTATPAAGWTFAGWVGCDSPVGNVCTVIPNKNPEIVTAQFTLVPAPLAATLNQSSYTTGQTLILTVTLDPALAGPGPVDAYILIDTPGFGTFSLRLGPSIVPGTVPIATNFTPFAFSGVLLALPLPAGLPAGAYQFRTLLTQAGTGNVIGAVDVTPFTFTP